MFTVGEFEVHLICDSQTLSDPGGMFGLVPRKLWARIKPPNEEHLITSNSLCLYIKAHGQHILVDTGMGSNKLDAKGAQRWHLSRPHGSLFDAIGRLGLAPSDINLVLNTHLHADHCLGNTTFTESGVALPSFPNAKHYVHQRELSDARQPNERTAGTYFGFNFEPLVESGQLTLIEGDTEILPGIKMVNTPGHTPGHCSVVLESQGQYAMFLCDLSSMAVHFEKLAWMTAYDIEPIHTLETKRIWQQWAIEHNALLFVVHDREIPAARLVKGEDGNLTMQPVPYEYL